MVLDTGPEQVKYSFFAINPKMKEDRKIRQIQVPMLSKLNVIDCFNYKIYDVPSVQYLCDA